MTGRLMPIRSQSSFLIGLSSETSFSQSVSARVDITYKKKTHLYDFCLEYISHHPSNIVKSCSKIVEPTLKKCNMFTFIFTYVLLANQMHHKYAPIFPNGITLSIIKNR